MLLRRSTRQEDSTELYLSGPQAQSVKLRKVLQNSAPCNHKAPSLRCIPSPQESETRVQRLGSPSSEILSDRPKTEAKKPESCDPSTDQPRPHAAPVWAAVECAWPEALAEPRIHNFNLHGFQMPWCDVEWLMALGLKIPKVVAPDSSCQRISNFGGE